MFTSLLWCTVYWLPNYAEVYANYSNVAANSDQPRKPV